MVRTTGSKCSPLLRYLLIFISGGAGYYLLEILYRGHSHWTMALCGGICLLGICFINSKFRRINAILRALLCALMITAVEFLAGCIVNVWLGLNVWSYNARPFNFMGQICLGFSFLWFVLSLAICVVLSISAKKKGATEGVQNKR